MSIMATLSVGLLLSLEAQQAATQKAPTASSPAAPVERQDPALDAADELIGRAVFLRCFCASNDLNFDASGKLESSSKTTDWTLAGMNVQKVARKGAGAVELDGVRVAVGFNAGAREWARHPQADEKMRVTIADSSADAAGGRAFQRALEAVFSVGIERSFQASMPDFWRHYFDPRLAWPKDSLGGAPVYVPGAVGLVVGTSAPAPGAASAPAVTQPVISHKATAQYTPQAQHEHVNGTTQVRFVVDSEGLPHQIAIVQPQGYGLDERAVEAVTRMRFTPAMREGKPVAATVLLNQSFELVTAPQ